MLLHSAMQANLDDGDAVELSEKEFKAAIGDKSDQTLVKALKLGDFLCRQLYGDPDERAPAAIHRLRTQQRWINEVIAERQQADRAARDESEPRPVRVNLSTLKANSKLRPGG